nr:hypothetical protein Iba_chr10cCG2280 [Ipomoea batatas]
MEKMKQKIGESRMVHKINEKLHLGLEDKLHKDGDQKEKDHDDDHHVDESKPPEDDQKRKSVRKTVKKIAKKIVHHRGNEPAPLISLTAAALIWCQEVAETQRR